MLLRKQQLTQAARKAFGLAANPFDGEVASSEEMFLTTDIRYCRDAAWSAAQHGRFVAVVGESGSGKTTIVGDLRDRIEADRTEIVVIAPSVLAMEDNDAKGKTLKSTSIADAIIYTIDPLAKPKRTMEAKTRQLQAMLEASSKAGRKHLLVIEEAHSLPKATLKHLKRFHELRYLRRPLLGILLVGQTELKLKLSEYDPELREVVQRCEVYELPPLEASLKDYLEFKAKLVGKELSELIEEDAIEAMRDKLVKEVAQGSRKIKYSQAYPLMLNNAMVNVLNEAASLGAPVVDRSVVEKQL